ncbi:hypothetical protein OIU85_001111 [Salix viminalis]|uniref:Uncharacterized protein n=1 Tax=Salix viminalis TaxID=40686 RepID=A0A9Q0ZXG8_SALVM|nr:hypothetical protein OIU85_001111 [Salix viminalis]
MNQAGDVSFLQTSSRVRGTITEHGQRGKRVSDRGRAGLGLLLKAPSSWGDRVHGCSGWPAATALRVATAIKPAAYQLCPMNLTFTGGGARGLL